MITRKDVRVSDKTRAEAAELTRATNEARARAMVKAHAEGRAMGQALLKAGRQPAANQTPASSAEVKVLSRDIQALTRAVNALASVIIENGANRAMANRKAKYIKFEYDADGNKIAVPVYDDK